MKGQIVYIKGHSKSVEQAKKSFASFKKRGWDVELVEGITPKTVEQLPEYTHYSIIDQSRLHNFKQENPKRFLTKVSCALNHVKFWNKVISYGEPMAFLEHDSICIDTWKEVKFKDYLILNAEFVFRPPNKLGLQQFKDYVFPGFGLSQLDENYPLTYYKDNVWKDSLMVPGTGAYAITPRGAEKMLQAIETHGIDQSDFMLNSYNIDIQYINPSVVKFNSVNLSTSYGI